MSPEAHLCALLGGGKWTPDLFLYAQGDVSTINRRKVLMKKLVIRIALGVVILVIVALVVVFFSLNTIVKKGVETVGPKLTQVDMRLKAAELSPLSGNGRLTGLFVGNPQGYQTPSAIQVGDIKVGLRSEEHTSELQS